MNDKEYLRTAARAVKQAIPDNHGFILLVFPFGEALDNRLGYVSDSDRRDCINVMKEFIIRNGADEDWLRHVK